MSGLTTVIIVDFRSEDVIGACIDSLPNDAEVLRIIQGWPATIVGEPAGRVRHIYSAVNRGFGAGCNIGAANARGDVLVFMNPDVVSENGAVERLSLFVRQAAYRAFAGPTILAPDGRTITRARLWTKLRLDLRDLLVPRSVLPDILSSYVPESDAVYVTGGHVGYVQGACMAVGRDAFLASGGFDERYFLYYEEEVLARRLAKMGIRPTLVPEAIVRHQQSTSTAKVARFATRQYFRSRALLYGDVWGPVTGGAKTVFLSLFLALMYISAPARRVIKYREIEDQQWCGDALRGTLDGLCRRLAQGPTTTAE